MSIGSPLEFVIGWIMEDAFTLIVKGGTGYTGSEDLTSAKIVLSDLNFKLADSPVSITGVTYNSKLPAGYAPSGFVHFKQVKGPTITCNENEITISFEYMPRGFIADPAQFHFQVQTAPQPQITVVNFKTGGPASVNGKITKQDGVWKEYNAMDEHIYTFRQYDLKDNSIYITDDSRNLSLQLDLSRNVILLNLDAKSGEKFSDQYVITSMQ